MGDSRAITTSMVGADALVARHGEIDITTCAELERSITIAARPSQRYVFVDLSSVTFIDAAAIGAIVRTATALDSQSRRLKLLGAAGIMQYVLDLTGIGAAVGIEAHLLDQRQATEL
jgi:anti-anti-sigma factor